MMSIWREVVELENSQNAGILCTVVKSQGSTPRHEGSKMLVYQDGSISGSIGGGELESRVIISALKALQDGKPCLLEYNMSDPDRGDPGVCGGQVEIYMEPIMAKSTLVIVGAGHVGRAVAHLADWLGFRVVVSDDREEFCTPEIIPEAEEFFPGSLADLSERLTITPWTYLVLTTRSVDIDVPGLPQLLESHAPYIGVIGSKRRWETTTKQLKAKGVPSKLIERVRSPMGLDIAAETPEEIAVSIMAEIISLRHVKSND